MPLRTGTVTRRGPSCAPGPSHRVPPSCTALAAQQGSRLSAWHAYVSLRPGPGRRCRRHRIFFRPRKLTLRTFKNAKWRKCMRKCENERKRAGMCASAACANSRYPGVVCATCHRVLRVMRSATEAHVRALSKETKENSMASLYVLTQY